MHKHLFKGSDKLIFGCFYRSPTESPYSHSNNAKLNELIIQLALSNRYTHCCFGGDFNFGKINWSNCSSPCSEESKEEKFLEALHIRESTWGREKDEPSTLDLILTNEENQISNLEYNAPLGKSDHSTLYFVYDCYINTNSIKDRFQFDKADYVSMIEDLEESNWLGEYIQTANTRSVNESWGILKDKIINLRDRYVPKKNGVDLWNLKGKIPIDHNLR